MKKLELKILPLGAFLINLIIMLTVVKLTPAFSFTIPMGNYLVCIIMIIAFIFGVGGVLEFKKNKTTIDPRTPEKTSLLVDGGVYQYSRNPMYFTLFLTLISYGLFEGNILAILSTALFPLYMSRFQIIPEERILEKKFGDNYKQYQVRVRRWI